MPNPQVDFFKAVLKILDDLYEALQPHQPKLDLRSFVGKNDFSGLGGHQSSEIRQLIKTCNALFRHVRLTQELLQDPDNADKQLASLIWARELQFETEGVISELAAFLVRAGYDQSYSARVRKPAVINLRKVRVLQIEDSEELLDAMRYIYESAGAVTYGILDAEAPNAPNVLEAIRDFKPNLITTGIGQMPLTGFEIIRALKAQVAQLPPIIVISTRNRQDSIAESLRLGAADFISKPFEVEYLLERTQSALQNN